jgi:hypothetical protein
MVKVKFGDLTVEEFEKVVKLLKKARDILKDTSFIDTEMFKKIEEAYNEASLRLKNMKKLEKDLEPLFKELDTILKK